MKMRTFISAAAFLGAFLATPAFADDVSTKSSTTVSPGSNGGYEAKDSMENTDANGTTTSRKTDEKVDVDSKGNKTTSVDIKSSTDPKGLFNKQTTETKNKAVEKDGSTEYSHKKTVNGTTVEQTDEKTSQ